MDKYRIEARKWFDRYYGNTYHSSVVYKNGIEICRVPFEYGYGRHWDTTALHAMQDAGLIPGEPKNGYLSLYLERQGHEVEVEVVDVKREKDLHGKGENQ